MHPAERWRWLLGKLALEKFMPVEDLRKLIYAGNALLTTRREGKRTKIQFLDEDGLVLAETSPGFRERMGRVTASNG